MRPVTDAPAVPRFYGDLAEWWPLISPPEDYAEEAAFAATLLDSASIPVREVLELGSGGGHSAVHLKARFAMTLVDLSPTMLEVSQRPNPECAHHRGDMRSVRLGRRFDAVFVHDAIDYMTTEMDLRAAIETAFVHCHPGGSGVFAPDHVSETFAATTDHGGSDGPDRGLRYLEWTWDPDPGDSTYQVDYAFLLKEPGGVRVEHDQHTCGLFSRETWMRLIGEAGFHVRVLEGIEGETAREVFAGTKPL